MSQTCIWISDHKPTRRQDEYLWQRGYVIKHLTSPQPNRWKKALDIYNAMIGKFGKPDIIIMILPSITLGGLFFDLIEKKLPGVPIYYPEMEYVNGEAKWLGTWIRVCGTHYTKAKEDIRIAY